MTHRVTKDRQKGRQTEVRDQEALYNAKGKSYRNN